MIKFTDDLAKLTGKNIAEKSYETKPIGFWKKDNMRKFLEEKARHFGFDPLIAGNWYSVSHQFLQLKVFF